MTTSGQTKKKTPAGHHNPPPCYVIGRNDNLWSNKKQEASPGHYNPLPRYAIGENDNLKTDKKQEASWSPKSGSQ